MKGFLAAALALAAVPMFAADIRGIYLYTEHPENASDQQQLLQALQVPGVDGVTLLVGWKLIEPSNGVYAWHSGSQNLLDQMLTAAVQAGKKVGLAIRAGQDTPAWLFQQPSQGGAGATPLQFEVAPLEGDVPSGSCNQVKIAAPWDPAFLSAWDSMLAAVVQHLHDTGTYANVQSVRLTGINRTTAELRLPAEILSTPCVSNSVETWLKANYRPAELLQAWDAVTNSFLKSFPDKVFTLPIIPSASGNGNREYPFPPIDDAGCPFQPPWPTDPHDPNFYATSCPPDAASFPSAFPPNPDQNSALLALASRKFAGRLVVAYQNLDPRFPAEPYVVYAAQTWGTMAAFQTNDYIGPFQRAACSVTSGQFGACTSAGYLSLLELGIDPCRTNASLCGNSSVQAEYIEVLPPDAIAFPDAILQAHAELTAAPPRHRAVSH